MGTFQIRMPPLFRARYRSTVLFFFIFVGITVWILISGPPSLLRPWNESPSKPAPSRPHGVVSPLLQSVSKYFVNYPLGDAQFGEMGHRVQILSEWVQASQSAGTNLTPQEVKALSVNIEDFALSLFPFLHNPSKPEDRTPFASLRDTFVPGSKGVVIPTGTKTFRYACHLVSSLRDVLGSDLSIQIAYAGDDDLPLRYRETIMSMGKDISTLDIKSVVDDSTVHLADGGWAIKPFALLASKFEQVILLDADDVFLQKPEVIFDFHSGYRRTGTLLFHDRLLWQGAFKERHEWWEQEMKHRTPSVTLKKSRVYSHGYAEEEDSGVVVLDKSRLPVLLGLLHICWQNTLSVREKYTYRMGYGDKESWWFGLELSGVPFTFEKYYGSIVGSASEVQGVKRVCGFTISHMDEADKLLWYNGSLLKNKAVNATAFDVPTHWMIDGVWEKGPTKADLSCMKEAPVLAIDDREKSILERSVDVAKIVDDRLEALGLIDPN